MIIQYKGDMTIGEFTKETGKITKDIVKRSGLKGVGKLHDPRVELYFNVKGMEDAQALVVEESNAPLVVTVGYADGEVTEVTDNKDVSNVLKDMADADKLEKLETFARSLKKDIKKLRKQLNSK